MTRKTWIIVLLAAGVGLALLIGLLGERGGESQAQAQAQAQASFCSSLGGLESSLESLTSLDPSSASKDDYRAAVSDIDSAWDEVKTDAGDLKDVNTSTLDSAWDSFKTVDDVPDDASVSDALGDVSQAAQSLLSTTKSTLTGPDCSSS
jgi:hypothetical protein